MLLERPMIDRTDLLWALDPRGELATARYRRLLRDGILTPGVIAHPRRAGRLAGSAHIFCALNREIIAAARTDRTDLLDELRAETLRIESGSLREWADAVSDRLVIDDESDERVALPVESGRALLATGRRGSPALDAARRSDPTLASPPPPAHLDALLDESRLSARSGDVPPLRRVA